MTPLDRWAGVLIFFVALQVIASVIRYCVRIFVVKRLGTDDLASFITLTISLTYCAVVFRIFNTAHAQESWMLPVDVLIADSNLSLAVILLYGLGTMCLKVTLGLFFLRILIQRWAVITIYIVIAVNVFYGLFFFFFNLFECGNPQNFAIRVISEKCFSTRTINGIAYTHACIAGLSDIILGLLPILYLWTANLDRRTKISVGGILILGSAGCVCTIVRIPWIHYLTSVRMDFFRTTAGIGVLSAAELSIGLTCLALTTFKPLFRHIFAHTGYTSRSGRSGGTAPPRDANGNDGAAMVEYHADPEVAAVQSPETHPVAETKVTSKAPFLPVSLTTVDGDDFWLPPRWREKMSPETSATVSTCRNSEGFSRVGSLEKLAG